MPSNRERIAGLRYLVVEDQGFQRWMIGNMLETLGAVKVFSAADGHAALEIVDSLDPPIDVVLTDLNMPGMDGIEFIRHLGEAAPAVALVVVSEQDPALLASVATMARAYGANLLEAIAKPVTARKLAAALQRLAERPAALERGAPAHAFTPAQILEGVERGEFEPFFQPKVDIRTGIVRGAEAFARWRNPQHGIVMPAAFVEPLQAASLLDALTFSLLRQAAAACRGWRRAGFDMAVAVNLSRTSLEDTSLADRVFEEVLLQQVEPRCVVLEVTETAAATNAGRVLDNLSRLRMKGFGLSIDDYGTGYSAMHQLTQVPFTEIKIDQAFVRNAPTHASSRAVLESSLEIAAKLGLPAVAEGVESKRELNLLLELGCPLAQGYYIARPMGTNDFLDWLLEGRRGAKAG
ncbi:MAG TPA: EAL domain-containing response regulator [Usitatibacter sp.]|nr:EAL domain-containing response regulator [Usitatibacter sp.]